ncbi:alpha/beta hydrolase [Bartonella sp. W8098]|uniref:alpha/beta hydrolase n=1 Tax=Bartonella TaxID=773 RepID=UPI0018DE9065|nr:MULTISPECIES: alpha/beta hydrolase [Bartonella]MBH9987608.1 alpha/beta hydrolase [Bartonella apis]MBI0171384.1 alpha/beta hydrolase [Bartonella sp. W8151]
MFMKKGSGFILAFLLLVLTNFICDSAFSAAAVEPQATIQQNGTSGLIVPDNKFLKNSTALAAKMSEEINFRQMGLPPRNMKTSAVQSAKRQTPANLHVVSKKGLPVKNAAMGTIGNAPDSKRKAPFIMINATLPEAVNTKVPRPLESGLFKMPQMQKQEGRAASRGNEDDASKGKTPPSGKAVPSGETVMQENSEGRMNLVHLPDFTYRIDRSDHPSGEVVILLHGSGGDETTLFPFARPIWPKATLIGIRGRIVQNGETRWFKKITPTKFDEKDASSEADAFVKFMGNLAEEHHFDLSRVTFVGYSNGANLLAVIMMRHPGFARRAILMRSMPVMDNRDKEDLSKNRILIISGKKDALYSPFAPALLSVFKKNGAKVDAAMVDSDHMIGEADRDVIVKWIKEQNPDRISANTKV